MEKTLQLNLAPLTRLKQQKLRETYAAFQAVASYTFQTAQASKPHIYTALHHMVYAENKRGGMASQLVEEAQRYAWQRRKIADKIQQPTVRFDKRLFSFKETRRGHPVLSVRANHERLGLPIQRDGAYRRLLKHMGDGWVATSVLMTCHYRFLVLLKKNPPTPRVTENVVGVDLNSNGVAVTVMRRGDRRILRQLYLGRNLALQQIRYENRRATLQEYRDAKGHRGKAGLRLRQLSGRQRSYVRTNTWLLAKQLTDLDMQYNASIAIERLHNLRRQRRELSRKSRRKINRIPYGFFRHTVTHKSTQLSIPVVEVSARYTSQTCPRCGYVSRQNRRNWRYFKCVCCGFQANADRAASVNICRKATQATYPVTKGQTLPTGAPVSVPVRQDEEVSWQQSRLQVASS